MTRVARAVLDLLVFSSAWISSAATALCAAASVGMGIRPGFEVLALVWGGTFVVYTVDRVRDLERDRLTTPERSAFVARYRPALIALAVVAVAVAVPLGGALGVRPALLLGPVLAAGLAHRRLKRIPFAKAAYITLAWVAVVVGLPAVTAPAPAAIGWVAGVLGAAILSSVIASSVRDDEAALDQLGHGTALRVARVVAVLGVVIAAVAPAPVHPLAAVPVLVLASVVWFRAGERYGLVVVDGALLAGGLVAVALSIVAPS